MAQRITESLVFGESKRVPVIPPIIDPVYFLAARQKNGLAGCAFQVGDVRYRACSVLAQHHVPVAAMAAGKTDPLSGFSAPYR